MITNLVLKISQFFFYIFFALKYLYFSLETKYMDKIIQIMNFYEKLLIMKNKCISY